MGVIDTCPEGASPAVEVEKRDYIFQGKKIVYVLHHDGTIWIRSKEIADILLYPDDEDITLRLNTDEFAQFYFLNPKVVGGQGNEEIHSQTVFLNQSGIHILVLQSENLFKSGFIRWIVNTVIPSIQQLDSKSLNDKIVALNGDYEIMKAENSGLKSEMRTKILEMDQQLNAARMEQRHIQFLEDEKRACEDSLDVQLNDAYALQDRIQVLITENRIRSTEIEEREIKIKNMELKIKEMETENQARGEALHRVYMEKQELHIRNAGMETDQNLKNRELEHRLNQITTLQNDILLLKNQNAMLNLQVKDQQVTAEKYGEITRKQNVLLHLLRHNFIPKPYDIELENQFLIFVVNDQTFFTYYLTSVRNSDINQRIKTIRTRLPNAVELLRIPFYPNAVNMLDLLKNHLGVTIRFSGNYFMIREEDYTDDDLKRDVLKVFNEAENTRQEVFRMMCIERDFRSTENKCSPTTTTTARKDVDTEVRKDVDTAVTVNETCGCEEEDNSTPDSNPTPADENSDDVEEDKSTPDPLPPEEISREVEVDNLTPERQPPPADDEKDETLSESSTEYDLYDDIVHEANA